MRIHESITTDETLEAILLSHLQDADLEVLADEAGVPVPHDANGDPLFLAGVTSHEVAGYGGNDRGVVLRLSDGSEFHLRIFRNR